MILNKQSTDIINSNLSDMNVYLIDLISKYLKTKLTYKSSLNSDNTQSYMISIERSENIEEYSLEGFLINSILQYNIETLNNMKLYDNIDLSSYETELNIVLILEYRI
mgnify:FL=1|tara:strand:+ start:180 stop:503 length:324 start_codon:yes stop_codon:yes gene_type:complete